MGRKRTIRNVAMECAAETIHAGMNPDGSLAVDDDGFPFVTVECAPTEVDFEALEAKLGRPLIDEDVDYLTEHYADALSALLAMAMGGAS